MSGVGQNGRNLSVSRWNGRTDNSVGGVSSNGFTATIDVNGRSDLDIFDSNVSPVLMFVSGDDSFTLLVTRFN